MREDLTHLQSVFWTSGALVETVGILLLVGSQYSLREPFVAFITTVFVLLVVGLTRKWVRSEWPDEKITLVARGILRR